MSFSHVLESCPFSDRTPWIVAKEKTGGNRIVLVKPAQEPGIFQEKAPLQESNPCFSLETWEIFAAKLGKNLRNWEKDAPADQRDSINWAICAEFRIICFMIPIAR